MAKDPAFLFYPGDYLRDTQTLSEKAQVAYDRIMCEHMRNICITQQQLKFFTKRLTDDEIEELKFVLTETDGGFQIEWVAESILKRKAYSDSRRKNRTSKKKFNTKNISKTYDKHMENENENVIEDKIIDEKLKIPKIDEFLEYGLYLTGESFPSLEHAITLKYESWKVNGWKTGGDKPREIKNWKNTLANTIQFLKPIEVKEKTINRQSEETIIQNSQGWFTNLNND